MHQPYSLVINEKLLKQGTITNSLRQRFRSFVHPKPYIKNDQHEICIHEPVLINFR